MINVTWRRFDKSAKQLMKMPSSNFELEGKYSPESTDPRESEIRAHLRP